MAPLMELRINMGELCHPIYRALGFKYCEKCGLYDPSRGCSCGSGRKPLMGRQHLQSTHPWRVLKSQSGANPQRPLKEESRCR